MQLELERVKNENLNQSISFKDAPFFIQLAMAAKAGLIDPQIAEYGVKLAVEKIYPELAAQQEQVAQQQQFQQQFQQQMPPEMQSEQSPEEFDKNIALAQMMQGQPQQNNQQTLTAPAFESLLRGMTPAM